MAILEDGWVLVAEERIEAEVANVELLETLGGEAVDAERHGGGTDDGGRQRKHERVDSLYAADREKEGIEADVEDEAEADGADQSTWANGLDEEAEKEAAEATGE